MTVFPFFDLEERLFFPYLPSKLSLYVEIWYVDFVGVLDKPFGDLVDFFHYS